MGGVVDNISLVDDCPICHNEKNIWKDGKLEPCICLIRSRLIRYLGHFAYARGLQETFLLFPKNMGKTLFLKGHPRRIASHIKHFLICQGMDYYYKYLAAQEIVDIFVGNDDETKSLYRLQDYDLVIVDLNSVYKNIALGDLLDQVTYMRMMVGKATWFVSEKDLVGLAPKLCTDSFSSRIKSMNCIIEVTRKNAEWRKSGENHE